MKNKYNLILYIIFLLFYELHALAYFEKISNHQEKVKMNDISFDDFKDFPLKWKLVTVRYRLDSKELRLIYANTKAWDGLKKLNPKYEDGAVFGKIAFTAESDPAFASSLTPHGVKRYQLMVKNSKKYSDTDGWGYALFNEDGGLFNEDMKVKTMACAACHRIVPERDYVFARAANFAVGKSKEFETKLENTKIIEFNLLSNSKISKGILQELITKNQDIYLLQGEIQKNAFSGTLDEIVPFLIEQVKKTGRTSALYLSDSHFTVVEKLNQSCTNQNEIKFHIVIKFNNGLVRKNEICQ